MFLTRHLKKSKEGYTIVISFILLTSIFLILCFNMDAFISKIIVLGIAGYLAFSQIESKDDLMVGILFMICVLGVIFLIHNPILITFVIGVTFTYFLYLKTHTNAVLFLGWLCSGITTTIAFVLTFFIK